MGFISKLIKATRGERSIISRKCIGIGPCQGISVNITRIQYNLRDVFAPTPCTVSIPDVTIYPFYTIDTTRIQDIIDNYVIADCSNPCPKSITLNLATVFDGSRALNGGISLEPSDCCVIDRALWETNNLGHIALAQAFDTGWRRICFIEGDEFPPFIAVTPLNIYQFGYSVIGNADLILGDYEAAIAPLTDSSCFTYVEAQEVTLSFRDPDVLVCQDNILTQIAIVFFMALCICIHQRETVEEEVVSNTKEDSEVMLGLNIGSWTYEQLFDTHILRQIKVR